RDVLDVAALIGSRVETALLEQVTACQPGHLDELIASGLIIGDGGWLRFRHEIARLAVAQAVPAHRAAPVHAAILAALRSLERDDDPGLAYHAEAAGDRDAVLHFAPKAARRAAELASHREAAAQYRRALRFADGQDARVRAVLYDGPATRPSPVGGGVDAAQAEGRAPRAWRGGGRPRRGGGPR